MNPKNAISLLFLISFAFFFLISPPVQAANLPTGLILEKLDGATNLNGIVESGGGCGCRQFGSSSPDPVALRRIILSAAFIVFVIVLLWKGGKKGKRKK
jgi:hypothetical protein